MGIRSFAVAALSGAVALWLMSGTQRETALLGAGAPQPVRDLEATVAAAPDDPNALCGLARAYLEARQPGLAVVLVEGASRATRANPGVQHVYARALVDEGRNDQALGAERRVLQACRPLAEGGATPPGCDAVLLASATRRAEILEVLLALGVEDAPAHPEETLVAYQNATREARVTVQ